MVQCVIVIKGEIGIFVELIEEVVGGDFGISSAKGYSEKLISAV